MHASTLVWKTVEPHREFIARLNKVYAIRLLRQTEKNAWRAQIYNTAKDQKHHGVLFEDKKKLGAEYAKYLALKKLLAKYEQFVTNLPDSITEETRLVYSILTEKLVKIQTNKVRPVSLKTAMRLTGIWDQPDELVFITDTAHTNKPKITLSVKAAKEKLDVTRTMIYRIRPLFVCGEYYGDLFESRFVNIDPLN